MLEKTSFVTVLVLALIVAPGAATSQQAEFWAPPAGAVCNYIASGKNVTLKFEETIGLETNYRASSDSVKNQKAGIYGWLVTTRSGGTKNIKYTNKEEIDAYWPLRVGNTASWGAAARSYKWDFTSTVLRFESVTVPAGTFDAFVIERTESNRMRPFHLNKIDWWAPALGVIVKQISRQEETGDGRTMELLNCSHPKREFSNARSAVPKIFRDCQAAEGSSTTKAEFMQALGRRELARYLEAEQSCSVFR